MTKVPALRDARFLATDPVKLSICTITFNHAAFLEQCLEGFLDQICDFRVEIIIHDDASTDGTAEIIQTYAQRYPDIIRPILQTDNQYSKGVNPYYAYVFPNAQGAYLAICDGDDYWDDPAKLSKQVAILDSEPDVSLTYGPVKRVQDDIETIDFKNGLERDLSPAELKQGLPINTLTTCFRNVFSKAPPMFLRSAPMGDMTVWAVLGHHGRGKFMPELGKSGYREHGGGIFSKESLDQKLFMGTITLLNMAAFHFAQSDKAAGRACLRRVLGQIVMINGAGASLREVMRKSLSLSLRKIRGKG
ncbi:glycosyltransferase family 2 protein [Phaeobacter porticola]|uniref:Glycosyltransferase EpsE n=1 Tax=Phaeobacter porticola TaxID=1844006 RepID=A0A1L3I065_9RHOB|nr:glycosyltransferase [Phaeobacter porticola]APG45518.1 Putative glycosyltransferase EpsE [Phaeobacter porticola]